MCEHVYGANRGHIRALNQQTWDTPRTEDVLVLFFLLQTPFSCQTRTLVQFFFLFWASPRLVGKMLILLISFHTKILEAKVLPHTLDVPHCAVADFTLRRPRLCCCELRTDVLGGTDAVYTQVSSVA